jgi:hypothetical protein
VSHDEVFRLGLAVTLDEMTPEVALDHVVMMLHSTGEDDPRRVGRIGCGPLENLFHKGYEDGLWSRIEQLARDDPLFRRALASAWAYRSPRYADRRALLEELGEID